MASPTITEVARLAGVSIATVSRCLNAPDKVGKKTLIRVRKIIEETRYSPNLLAQNFRRGKTNIILVVVHEVGNWLFSEMLDGIRSVLGGRYSLILTESRQNLSENNNAIDMLVARQVEGVILLCSPLPFSQKLIDSRGAAHLPVVIGLEPLSDDLNKLPSVHIDNHQAAFDATHYLIGLGHTDISFISGPRHSYVTKDREAGYLAAMTAAGLTPGKGAVLYSDLSVNGGVNAAHDALSQTPRPTAIFCANDDMALGVMSVAAKLGLSIPNDLSVMGFDDMRYAAISIPSLSTVAQPVRDIGVRAAERLISAIEHPTDDQRLAEIMPHRLVIRQSTGPLLKL